MTEGTLASVVIPSYNCAPLLRRAVASAFAIDTQRLEVIVVDDGSTDDTPALCLALQQDHPGLQVIRQPNGGLSAARNTGIQAACGEFVVLLDADDELIPFDLEVLSAFDGEILRVGVEEVAVDGQVQCRQECSAPSSGADFLRRHLQADSLYVPSWAYAYRRSFLVQKGLRFMPGLIHEDMLFTVQALAAADRVASSDALVYRYIRRAGSITLQRSEAAILRRIASLEYIVSEVLQLANQRRDVDFWRWAEHVTDYAWSFALEAESRRLAWRAFQVEWRLFSRYRGWGPMRTRPEVLWRLRRGARRLVRPQWSD